MDCESGRDLLSELPLSIIHSILELVPIRDAVKTCILSRQWRYIWASLPDLVFKADCSTRDHYDTIRDYENSMENFITHVLFLHKGPIRKFKLSVPYEENCQNIAVCWLFCLSKNDIRELIIDMSYYDFSQTQELHSSIYYCEKLIKLELYNCTFDPPPTTFKAFLFLRSLCLHCVFSLSITEVESLVANCPILEEFTSIDCLRNTTLRVSAPNLKLLHLRGVYFELFVHAPLLAELSVELDHFYVKDRQRNTSVCNYTNFISGFTNLEKLHGYRDFTKTLSRGIESCHETLVFHRLKDIDLNEVNFEDIKHVSVVARLILGAPNLQKLKISNISRKDDDASEVTHVSFSDFGCAPDFKLEKLRVVEMNGLTGLPPQMAFIKFLLERSPVLETMSFSGLSCEEQQKLSAELQGCNMASPNAKLVMTTYE